MVWFLASLSAGGGGSPSKFLTAVSDPLRPTPVSTQGKEEVLPPQHRPAFAVVLIVGPEVQLLLLLIIDGFSAEPENFGSYSPDPSKLNAEHFLFQPKLKPS